VLQACTESQKFIIDLTTHFWVFLHLYVTWNYTSEVSFAAYYLQFCFQFNLQFPTSCTTFSACSRPIYLFVLHCVSRTHSSGPQWCSLHVYRPHYHSVNWLNTLCNADWMAHICVSLKTFFNVPIVPLHIGLNGDIF